jgi:hypothetical protein
MSPTVTGHIREAAMADNRPAREIMEEAALQWLERRKRGSGAEASVSRVVLSSTWPSLPTIESSKAETFRGRRRMSFL